METKICTKCKKPKELCEFCKNNASKDKLHYWCNECLKEYRIENTEKYKEYKRKYYENNKEKIKKRSKEWHIANPEKVKKSERKWVRNNIEKVKLYREKYKDRRSSKQREKRRYDFAYRLNANISKGISKSLRGNKNGCHWEGLTNYNLKDLKEHLETQFKEGMTWDNYGKNGWHIDHRIPKSLFNITSAKCKGFKKCWELSNLQPLWESDNIRKKDKLFW